MRLATWNVNSVTARLPRLVDWLDQVRPDVVCLQETKVAQFPSAEVERLGYEVAAYGMGGWNGVAVLSRVGLDDVRIGFAGEPGFPDVEARAIGVTCAGARIWSVYVPNGRTPTDEHYTYKLAWLAALRTALAVELGAHTDLVVCGDFNVAPTDADGLRGCDTRDATGAGRAGRPCLARPARCGPHPDEGPEPLYVLGLPRRNVPSGQGDAHRPRLCVRDCGRPR